MRIIAIDPGNTESAWLVFDTTYNKIMTFKKESNDGLISRLHDPSFTRLVDRCAIEMVASYGMAVGATVFDTVFWAGRFAEAWRGDFTLVYRKEVKMHLCNSMRAKDGNIRQALIDRFGAPGTKANPGGTYGISKDVWSALAIAVTFADKMAET